MVTNLHDYPYVLNMKKVMVFYYKVKKSYSQTTVAFKGSKYVWIRPVTLSETLELIKKHPDATLVMGCTFIGKCPAFSFDHESH